MVQTITRPPFLLRWASEGQVARAELRRGKRDPSLARDDRLAFQSFPASLAFQAPPPTIATTAKSTANLSLYFPDFIPKSKS